MEVIPGYSENPSLTSCQRKAPHKILSSPQIGLRCGYQGAFPGLHLRPKEDQIKVVPWLHVRQDLKECLLGLQGQEVRGGT